MFDLRKTLTTTSSILSNNGISHALIGGFALAAHGVNRATVDIDFLADGDRKAEIIQLMTANGFQIQHQSDGVLQFTGTGFVNIVLANRLLSKKMVENATLEQNLNVLVVSIEDIIGLKIQAFVNDPSRELQDKADIQALFTKHLSLDWAKIKSYADLFQKWDEIEKLRPSK